MTNTRRWLPIVAGVAILLVFVGIGAAVVSISWMRAHLHVTPSSRSEAAAAFEALHAQFPERPPLIEWRDGRPVVHANSTAGGAPTTALTTVHLLAWNRKDQRLARFEMPFWLLRLKSTPIQFGAYAAELDEAGVSLRAEDIERYGPGILLDLTLPEGERVIVWAE